MTYLAKLKALIDEKGPPHDPTELTKGASVSFVGRQGGGFWRDEPGQDALPETVRDAIEERKAICSGCIPAIYLDAWARLNHQKPSEVSADVWYRAVDDGGRLFDAWGDYAAQWGWTAGDLFDVPREGKLGGLVWFCAGESVTSFGPDHCRTETGRVFDRLAMEGTRHG